MDLQAISQELEKLGYTAIVHKSIRSVAAGISDDKTVAKLDSIFSVEEKNRKMYLMYFIRQIPVEKEFATIESLLDFVKEVFPIEQ